MRIKKRLDAERSIIIRQRAELDEKNALVQELKGKVEKGLRDLSKERERNHLLEGRVSELKKLVMEFERKDIEVKRKERMEREVRERIEYEEKVREEIAVKKRKLNFYYTNC